MPDLTPTDTTTTDTPTPSLTERLTASATALERPADDATTALHSDTQAVTAADDGSNAVVESEALEEASESDETAKDGDAVESEEATEDTAALDAAFTQALKKFGVSIDLSDASDIPAAARPALLGKLKSMEAGYTKAMQEQRSYRQEKAEFDAEKTYAEKNPEQFIADLLSKDAALVDRVNAEMDKRKDPTYSEALQMKRDAAKDRAAVEAKTQEDQQAQHDARVDALDAYVISAVKSAGVPYDLVQDAIVLATKQKYDAGDGLITEAEIDAVIQAKAKVYRQHVGAVKGAKTREYVKDKVNDRTNTSNKTKPSGSGVVPAPQVPGEKMSMIERMKATIESMAA